MQVGQALEFMVLQKQVFTPLHERWQKILQNTVFVSMLSHQGRSTLLFMHKSSQPNQKFSPLGKTTSCWEDSVSRKKWLPLFLF